jgi:hypothetical protein
MDQLQEIIRQAELKQKNLELEMMFQKNMEFFSQAEPTIYNKYRNYIPTKIKMMLMPEGYINLVNADMGNSPVFNKDPLIFCQEYVNQYKLYPSRYRVLARTTKALDAENDAHISKMNPLIDYINSKELTNIMVPLEQETQFMLVMGIGLGFHITQLLQVSDIKHLCIIEPHEDIFYAALHTLDWHKLYEHFDRENTTFNLILGQTPDECYEQIRVYLNQIGLFNAAKPNFFDHLSSPEMKATTSMFFEKLPTLIGAMGYFDDEQISLSHSVANYRNEVPILRDHVLLNQNYRDKPAFVIANGPSLDKAKDFLLANRDKAVIFSCGTALGSLIKLGIKPDFHIEMERTRPVVEWIETSTTEEIRKEIILLGLNTVHPDTYALFNTVGMGMKSNDLGTHFICQYIGEEQFVINMALSNPTVGNTGMAFSAALGFNEIYLFGMDFGFAADGAHHSALSKHYDIGEEHQESLNLYKHNAESNITLEGNFGNKITSTTVYSHARLSIEALLQQNPHIHCYNTSEGAFIRGAKPTHYADINLEKYQAFDKSSYTRKLFDSHFSMNGLKKIKNNDEVINKFSPVLNLFTQFREIFTPDAHSRSEAFLMLTKHHNLAIAAGKDKVMQYAYSLIKGSVHSFNFVLAKSLYNGSSIEEGVEIFNNGKQYYLDFMDHAEQKLLNNLLKTDTRSRNLAEKIKPKKA